jgi:hypothetical protein
MGNNSSPALPSKEHCRVAYERKRFPFAGGTMPFNADRALGLIDGVIMGLETMGRAANILGIISVLHELKEIIESQPASSSQPGKEEAETFKDAYIERNDAYNKAVAEIERLKGLIPDGFKNWLWNNGWQLHSSGEYYYQMNCQWPPKQSEMAEYSELMTQFKTENNL